MQAEMAIDEEATRQWAKQHKAAWEITPLHEVRQGERVRVGFALDLYVRIPDTLTVSEERLAPFWERLREIAESLPPVFGPEGRIELEPFDVASRLRAETQYAPEFLLQARLLHAADAVAPVLEDDRERLRQLESRLLELGLRPRTW